MEYFKSDIITLQGVGVSMPGGRPDNQDDWTCLDTPLGFLLIVCDGMGGGPGGKTASYIVKNEIAEIVSGCSPQTPRDHALKMAAARAHKALEEKMEDNPALIGMGSTFVAVLVNGQSAVVAHAGDSRLYRLHGKRCLFRTHDHSLVAELVAKKVMTEEEARQSPQSNVITRGLGSTKNNVPEIVEIPYKKGDRLVLCTDGVWGSMTHQELMKNLTQPIELSTLLARLSADIDQRGNGKGGGHDNHTIVMFEMGCSSQKKDLMSWQRILMFSGGALVALLAIAVCLYAALSPNREKESKVVQSTNSIYTSTGTETRRQYDNFSQTDNGDANGEGHKNVENDKGKSAETEAADTNCFKNDMEMFKALVSQRQNPKGDADSDNKQKKQEQKGKQASSKPIETTQKIINRYDSVKTVGKKKLDDAKKSVAAKKAEIKELFIRLKEQTQNRKALQKAEDIEKMVDVPYSWYVDKVPDQKTGLYSLTEKAKKLIDKQIARLKELMDILEKETE